MSKASTIRNGVAISLGLALVLPVASRADEAPPVVAATEQAPDAAKSDAKATKADVKPEPEGWHRDGFAMKNGKNKIEIVGYAQEDFRHYDWTVKGDETGSAQAAERELRRLRIGTKAQFDKLSLEFVVDPRNSQKGARLKDVTVGYEFSKKFNLLVGHFKPPSGQEFLTSASKTDFVDRSMIGSRLVPDREWGAEISGGAGRVEYAIGGFDGDGDANTQSAGTSGAARLTLKLVKGLSVSGSFMQGDVTADPKMGSNEPSPKGASGQTATKFTFWNRAHVNGARQRIGGDLQFSRGPFRIQAEYLQNTEEREGQGSTGQDIPDIRGRGWSAQASYVLTGEKKGSTVEPEKSIFQGGKGAIEIVARAEALKFDDTGDPSGFAGYGNRARNIAPSGASALQAGVNYWASNFMKLQGSALWESYNDPLIAPSPGKTGRYFTLVARVQFMIP